MKNSRFICPACKSSDLYVKYEAKYVYSYRIDSDAPGQKNSREFLPFMYDRREQKEARQYIECSVCKAQYPCFFNEGGREIDFNILERVDQLHSAHQ